MAKSSSKNEIEKVTPKVAGALQAPDFMNPADMSSNDDLRQYIIPGRIKIVQKTSGPELQSEFTSGDVIIVPTLERVASIPVNDKGKWTGEKGRFWIVPIFFFPEWIAWNPIETRGKESGIRQRTTDRNSPLVAKCRNSQLWKEPHPTEVGRFIENREHLNFLCMVFSDEMQSHEPVVLSFSKTNHAIGTKLASLINARKAPLYGCVFEVTVDQTSNEKGDWFKIEVSNPTERPPFVQDQEEYKTFQLMNAEFKKLHEASRIQMQYDEVVESTAEATNEL